MGLTQSQKTILEKARSLGAGEQGVALTDDTCAYLIGVIARDLDLSNEFPELPPDLPAFFGRDASGFPGADRLNLQALFARLVSLNADTDTYFACLAALHKARLKYERVLMTQPIPTIEQVGPRSLLQFGRLTPPALAALLFWRKWFYDIDNRAAQETGYLFEPIIAHAIGGAPASGTRSPIKRNADPAKTRQVDCIRDKRAYEFKMRVTIAASGQGRWAEELDYPIDCRTSGYTPVLIVLDSTPNPKLSALEAAFRAQNGEVYIGVKAWEHLDGVAGHTMASFLERYIRLPLQSLLATQLESLPKFAAEMGGGEIRLIVGGETLRIDRSPSEAAAEPEPERPEDAADFAPGL